MTRNYTRQQVNEIGRLFGHNYSRVNLQAGQFLIQGLFQEYGVDEPYDYSPELIQKIIDAVKLKQQQEKQRQQKLLDDFYEWSNQVTLEQLGLKQPSKEIPQEIPQEKTQEKEKEIPQKKHQRKTSLELRIEEHNKQIEDLPDEFFENFTKHGVSQMEKDLPKEYDNLQVVVKQPIAKQKVKINEQPQKQKTKIQIQYPVYRSDLSPQFVNEQLRRLGKQTDDLSNQAALELLSLQLQTLNYDDSKLSTEARIRAFLDNSIPDQHQEQDLNFLQPLTSEAISDIRDRIDNPKNNSEIRIQKEQLNEKYKKIHQEFNDILEEQLQTFKMADEEIIAETYNFNDKELKQIEIEGLIEEQDKSLLLTEPVNLLQFLQCLRQARRQHPQQLKEIKGKIDQDGNEPTHTYINNQITSLDDIHRFIKEVFEKEKENHFKIAVDFGYIQEYQDVTPEGEQILEYDSKFPRKNLTPLNIKSLITSQEDMDTYDKYIETIIINNQERTEESTKHHFIAVFSMIVIAYRIPFAGKAIPELQKFIKRREVHFVESPYPNNCFFEALSYLSMPDSKTNRYRSQNRVAEGIRLIIQYYSLSGNSAKCRDVQNFLADLKDLIQLLMVRILQKE